MQNVLSYGNQKRIAKIKKATWLQFVERENRLRNPVQIIKT